MRFLETPPWLGFNMGFFVRHELEVLVGSADWGEKVGPITRPRGEALIQARQRDKYTETDRQSGWERSGNAKGERERDKGTKT